MPRIFINYRRDDSAGYAGRIHDTLASVFGHESVFIDIDDIAPGVDFVSRIEESVAQCDVMIVLIGKRWLDARDASGRRRIDDPADFVRIEIEKGLARHIRLLPVLIDTAPMPTHADLPSAMAPLATVQALVLSDSRWQYDMSQLVNDVTGPAGRPRRNRGRLAALAGAATAVVAAVVFLTAWLARPSPDVSGRWVADVRYDFGVSHAETFAFRLTDGTLAGTASFLGVERGIVNGNVHGARVSFTTRSEERAGDDARQAEHRYGGTFSGDEIRLSMQTDGGFSPHAPVEFVARRPGPSHDGAPGTAKPADPRP